MKEVSEYFIEELNKKNEIELAHVKSDKILPVLNVVEKFFKANKIVLYGGTAMNMYLPQKHQFYKEYDVPDYDGFCGEAKNLSIKLMKELEKRKHKYLLVKYAIHDGTYKVSWEYNDIADMTTISDYETILKTSKIINGFYVASVHLLKSNAYIELGMPKSSMFRWSKVFSRIKLLEEHVPVKSPILLKDVFKKVSLCKHIHNVIQIIFNYVKNQGLPLVGNLAIKYYLKLSTTTIDFDNIIDKRFRYIQVLSNDMYATIDDVKILLEQIDPSMQLNVIESKRSDLIPNKMSIDVKYKDKFIRLISVFDSTKHCYSVHKTEQGYVYVSIFFILYMLYYYLFKNKNTTKISGKIMRIIIELTSRIRNENFVPSCYGFEKTLSVIKKSRARKKMPAILYKDSLSPK